MRIAYVFGVNGSGKGRIVSLLRDKRQLKCIEIDAFRRTLLHYVVPFFQSHSERKLWDVYRVLFETPSVQHSGLMDFGCDEAIARIIDELCFHASKDLPVVVEGGMLAYDPLFRSFDQAIRRKLDVDATQFFWIDPDPKQIHANKTQHRRRRGEVNEHIGATITRSNWYRKQMEEHSVTPIKFEDVNEAAAEIDRYFE